MLIFTFLILLVLPGFTADMYCCRGLDKHNWEVWVPSRVVCEVESSVSVQPEVDKYPVGVVAMQFSLENDNTESFYHGQSFTIIKRVDGVWRVVPMRGYGAFWHDLAMVLGEGQSRRVFVDVELMYGKLCVGEYAIVIDGWLYDRAYHAIGRFAIVAEGYDVSAEETAAEVCRPMLYEIVSGEALQWLMIWTQHGTIIYNLAPYEEFDTTGMVNAETLREANYWVFAP
ncbi:MAG: hypothetical protein FWC78_01500 [Defluviitaleaceae bacterium]|nr:hypothetical protein [Defluviitaleaceae bacterium]